jgi:hypothetical protein
METGEVKGNELEKLKKKIKEKLAKDEGYTELLKKKNNLIESLKKTEANRYEARKLLEKYDNIGNDIKELELKMAFDVLANEKTKRNKAFLGLLKKKKSNNEEYEQEFNSIVKDDEYRKLIKIRSGLFYKMKETFIDSQNQLYELDSLETEIATIETDKLRELFRKSEN